MNFWTTNPQSVRRAVLHRYAAHNRLHVSNALIDCITAADCIIVEFDKLAQSLSGAECYAGLSTKRAVGFKLICAVVNSNP